MKKQYIFLILIGLILYETYLIISYNIEDFKINSYIFKLETANEKIKEDIKTQKEHLLYINTLAFINKTAKESQNKMSPGEEIIIFVNEKKLDNIRKIELEKSFIKSLKKNINTSGMTNFQKWINFTLKIDLR